MWAKPRRPAAANIQRVCAICIAPPSVSWVEAMTERTALLASDVQARRPSTYVSLSRVGVTGVEKVIRIQVNGKAEQLFYAELECFVDLGPDQKGAHMSRFEEVINEAIDEVILSEAFKAETLASHIAERVRDRQEARRAEVTIAAHYPEHKHAPVSGSRTQELYKLFGSAVASARGTRRLVGVEAQGMTACPCAQELVMDRSHERLAERGFSEDEIARVFESVPVATHNQRGVGTLHIGCPEGCEDAIHAETLLEIVEASMSSEIYELMKRSDEVEVVEKAHMHPRFVEDCVREMVRRASERFEPLGDEGFISARQENLETIHKHNVVAERHGLIGELRREIADGERSRHHMAMREWLEAGD
jgi:GTP cyclohydrolase IV